MTIPSISGALTPSISTPKTEKAVYDNLVAQYVEAKSPQDAKDINDHLVREYKIDLKQRTYDGKPLPIKTDKATADVATVAYSMFQISGKKVTALQAPAVKLGFGVFALGFARMVNLFGRLLEVLKGLLRSNDDLKKLYVAKAVELHASMVGLFEDKLLAKIENPTVFDVLLTDMGQLLKNVEVAVKKKNFSGADIHLADMSDKLGRMKEEAVGIFRRLLEQVKGTSGSSYKNDLQDVNSILASLDVSFTEQNEHISDKTTWESFKKEANELSKLALKFNSGAFEPSIHDTLALVELRLKTNELRIKVDRFIAATVNQ